MNAIPMFDTHRYVKKLKTVGFTEQQAEVLASEQMHLLEDHLVTKKDLRLEVQDIKRGMKELEMRLTMRMTIRFGAMIVTLGAFLAALKLV